MIAVVALLLSSSALAHSLDMALLVIKAPDATVSVRLEVNPMAATALLDDGTQGKALEKRRDEIFAKILAPSRLSRNGKDCHWVGQPAVTFVSEVVLSVLALAACPGQEGALRLELPYLATREPTYRLVARAEIGPGDQSQEFVGGAEPSRPFVEFRPQETHFGISRFVAMGLEHVGAAPSEWWDPSGFHLPKGIDHILFVLALLVSGGSLLGLAKCITGFTLGHTLSLAAASFGLVQFSGRWIEAAIALTIAWVAFEGLFKRKSHNRWKVTITIGIIHGLGFAAALSELKLSTAGLIKAVVGFNVGVELGQLTIVALTLPFFLWAWRSKAGQRVVVPAMSIILGLIGCYWFYIRVK